VKNDERDATDLADLLRMGRLPEAWIAPPATRELRELVRHRAKLVALRSGIKASAHAVLAKCGVSVPMSDLFGVGDVPPASEQVAGGERSPLRRRGQQPRSTVDGGQQRPSGGGAAEPADPPVDGGRGADRAPRYAQDKVQMQQRGPVDAGTAGRPDRVASSGRDPLAPPGDGIYA
jgi:hypothetical protein